MIVSIIILIGISVFILILENQLTLNEEHFVTHPLVDESNQKNVCWLTENWSVAKECDFCNDLERLSGSEPACNATGKKELIKCEKSGEVYRSCHRVIWMEERNFWAFESTAIIFGIFSSIFVIIRQGQLDRKMMDRIQKQIAQGV